MIFETSWDDGSKYDWKLITLLQKYKIPAVFYIPINSELGMDQVRDIAKIYEIGCHTFSHPQDMKLLDNDRLWVEVRNAKEALETVIGKEVMKFCYPRGRYNEFVRDFVKDAGFKEARTTKVLYTRSDFDPFEKPTTIHAYQRSEYQGVDWLKMAKDLFDMVRDPKTEVDYYHLWGHSAEIEKYKDWDKLEELLKYINENLDTK